MRSTTLKPNIATVLVALIALVAATMLSAPVYAANNTDVNRISAAEFRNHKVSSDEYKLAVEPNEKGSITINVEPGPGQTLDVNKNGDLDFMSKSGRKQFQLDNLDAVAKEYPGAKIGDWKLNSNGASVKITAPSKVQASFEKSASCDDKTHAGPQAVDAQAKKQSYGNCMLENGVKMGIAGAIGGCATGAFAAGVGCIAAIVPGATGGYLSGLAIALWDCKDKL